MKIGSLCTGIGGLDMAAEAVFDGETAWVSEIDPGANAVLDRRFGGVDNHGDIKATVGGLPYVDVLTAGFPCQGISQAGKRLGFEDKRSALWFTVLAHVESMRPEWVMIENVPRLKTNGLDIVLEGLTTAGYGGSWCFYRSGYFSKNPSGFAHVGGCHQRKRLFILAKRGAEGFSESKPDAYDDAAGSVAKLLPSPVASDGVRGPDFARAERAGSGGDDLVTAVAKLLPTPMTDPMSGNGHARSLGGEVRKLLPTPMAARSGSSQGGATWGHGRGPEFGPVRYSLDSISKLLPTPTAGRGATPAGPKNPKRGVMLHDVPKWDHWGEYEAAVRRWTEACGWAPPAPALPGTRQLNAALPEWMQGYAPGYVTEVDIPRTAMLQTLGNAVQPQVGIGAFGFMLPIVEAM